MTIKLQLISFVIAVLLTIGMASAQTLIAGKIYNADYSSVVEGASVTVQCNVNSLTTDSLSDGTYAVRFDISNCTLGNGVSITATKGTLSGTKSGVVAECSSGDCKDEYSTVINTAIKSSSSGNSGGSSSGGSSGGSGGRARVYICGNGKCDSGETATTCAKDCKTTETNTTNRTCSGTTCAVNQTEPIALNNTDQVSFGITGASVLWDSLTFPLSLALSVLAFLIIILVGHKAIQKRKKRVNF